MNPGHVELSASGFRVAVVLVCKAAILRCFAAECAQKFPT